MLSNVNSADVYTDINGLAALKREAKQKTPEAIKEVAKQFESIFLGMVLKNMRAASLTDGSIMDNDQSKFYQDMYDQQLSVNLAGESGVGLADLIAKQLSPEKQDPINTLGINEYRARPVHMMEIKERIQTLESLDTTEEINSKEGFVRILGAPAQKAAKELGVDAKVLLAQAALETGWGKSIIKTAEGGSSFNLFNIKTHKSWEGKQAIKNTVEFDGAIAKKEKASFRAYDSYQDSFNDYVNFIKTNPRYHQALQHASKADQYIHELQSAGYATDPAYAQKVLRVSHDKVFSDLGKPAIVAANTED